MAPYAVLVVSSEGHGIPISRVGVVLLTTLCKYRVLLLFEVHHRPLPVKSIALKHSGRFNVGVYSDDVVAFNV